MRKMGNRPKSKVMFAVFGLSAAAVTLATVNAQASSWHVRNSACAVTVTGSGTGDITASCPFNMPSGKSATSTYLGTHKAPLPNGAGNHVWGQLTRSWDSYAANNTLTTYSPMINFRMVCSTALGNWSNSDTFPTGYVILATGYSQVSGGQPTPNQYCPSSKPILLGSAADTQVQW